MWDDLKATDYTIDQHFVCECLQRPARLHVLNDSIVSATYLSDGKPVPTELVRHYMTINQLFNEVENFRGDSIVVEYHETQYYPRVVSIEPQQQPVDGGVIIETSNLDIQ